MLAYLPIVERTTAHSIRYTAPDILGISRFLQFTSWYEPNISP